MHELRDVSHVHGNGTRALDPVTLSIPRAMYGLLGPDRAGKSTLMRTVVALQTTMQGICFDDVAMGPGNRFTALEGDLEDVCFSTLAQSRRAA